MINRTYDSIIPPYQSASSGKFMGVVSRINAKGVRRLFSKDSSSEIVFLGLGSQISNQQMTHIQEFRSKQYLQVSPWLLPDSHRVSASENFIDRMSSHLMVLKRNRVYGVARLTPYPFFRNCQLNLENEVLKNLENHFELNGMVTLNTDQKLNCRLVSIAAAYTYLDLEGEGLVALSNAEDKLILEKLGMSPLETVQIPNRGNQNYYLMSSSFRDFFGMNFRRLAKGLVQ